MQSLASSVLGPRELEAPLPMREEGNQALSRNQDRDGEAADEGGAGVGARPDARMCGVVIASARSLRAPPTPDTFLDGAPPLLPPTSPAATATFPQVAPKDVLASVEAPRGGGGESPEVAPESPKAGLESREVHGDEATAEAEREERRRKKMEREEKLLQRSFLLRDTFWVRSTLAFESLHCFNLLVSPPPGRRAHCPCDPPAATSSALSPVCCNFRACLCVATPSSGMLRAGTALSRKCGALVTLYAVQLMAAACVMHQKLNPSRTRARTRMQQKLNHGKDGNDKGNWRKRLCVLDGVGAPSCVSCLMSHVSCLTSHVMRLLSASESSSLLPSLRLCSTGRHQLMLSRGGGCCLAGNFKYVSEKEGGVDTPVCNTSDIIACEKIKSEESKNYFCPHAFTLTYRGVKKEKDKKKDKERDKDVERSLSLGANSALHSAEVQPVTPEATSESPGKPLASAEVTPEKMEGGTSWAFVRAGGCQKSVMRDVMSAARRFARDSSLLTVIATIMSLPLRRLASHTRVIACFPLARAPHPLPSTWLACLWASCLPSSRCFPEAPPHTRRGDDSQGFSD